jgi:hypothetical protein
MPRYLSASHHTTAEIQALQIQCTRGAEQGMESKIILGMLNHKCEAQVPSKMHKNTCGFYYTTTMRKKMSARQLEVICNKEEEHHAQVVVHHLLYTLAAA